MEDLTKHQLILVALLVSFVTSIATGIFTVALMEQAPQNVAQNVTHIIQETVDKTVPAVASVAASSKISDADTSGAVTSEPVISDDDALQAAVQKGSNAIVRIQALSSQYPPAYLALGTVISQNFINQSGNGSHNSSGSNNGKGDLIVAASDAVLQGAVYQGIVGGGNVSAGATTSISLIGQNGDSQLSYFQVASTSASLIPEILGDSDGAKVGESVVVLGGDDHDTIARGVVTGLVRDSNGLAEIQTDAVPIEMGAPLLDLTGNIIGFEMSGSTVSGGARFLPVNLVKNELEAMMANTASTSATSATSAMTPTSVSSSPASPQNT